MKLAVVPVVVTLLGVVAIFLIAGRQEVAGDHAVEQSKEVVGQHSDRVRVALGKSC